MLNVVVDTGVNLHYKISGNGYPVILISGLVADHTAWDTILPYLQDSYQIITFDRGTGRSDVPDQQYTTEAMAVDVIGLMNALQIDKAHIVGHSMGGAIGQQIALSYPDRVNRLILINSFSKINHVAYYTILGRLQMAELDIPLRIKIETNLSWLYCNRSLRNINRVNSIIDRISNNFHPQSIMGFKYQASACFQHDTRKKIHEVKQSPQ